MDEKVARSEGSAPLPSYNLPAALRKRLARGNAEAAVAALPGDETEMAGYAERWQTLLWCEEWQLVGDLMLFDLTGEGAAPLLKTDAKADATAAPSRTIPRHARCTSTCPVASASACKAAAASFAVATSMEYAAATRCAASDT